MDEKIKVTDQHREVIAWLRGGDLTPNSVMEERFLDMVTSLVLQRLGVKPMEQEQSERALERQLRRQRLKEIARPCSIRGIMEGMGMEYKPEMIKTSAKVQETTSVAEVSSDMPEDSLDDIKCCGLDSVNLARTLIHMGNLEGLSLSNSQVQVILYIAYGVWMSDKGMRLTNEHPQMWQYGPVFPRAYNKIKKGIGDCSCSYEVLKTDHPQVFNLLTNCFRRFARNTASVLSAPHMAEGTPWASKRKESPDKWGVPMDDRLIGKWFEQMKS